MPKKARSVHKVLKHNDKYVMFYSEWCSYSQKAINKIKSSGEKYKFYDIDVVDNGMDLILDDLNKNASKVNFNPKHLTRPVIFYKGKFVGGYSELN